MVDKRELDFLWKLFYLHITEASNALLDEHINTSYDMLLELDGGFEEKIDEFVRTRDRNLLDAAILEALKRQCFSAKRHVQLVAAIVGMRKISLIEGADLLVMCRSNREELPEAVGHALDIAWLINEDRRDSVMDADGDSLLRDALANVAEEFRAQF